MTVIVNTRNNRKAYGSLFTTKDDKIATKMTAMEELERREKEIKSMLELADSLDERKALRTELRDIRRKIFDGPSSTNTTTAPVSISTSVKEENAKNLDLNSNRISIKKASTTTEKKTNNTSTTRITTTSAKVNMSVARRSRLFETDDNNNKPEPEKPAGGIKLKVQNQGDEAPALRTRDPADRAARRARRTQQQREMSIDQGKGDETPAPQPKTSVVIDTPKKEESKPRTPSIKVNNSLGVNGVAEKPSGGATGLRRAGTWGGPKDRDGAANNIGKALGKFGSQTNTTSSTASTTPTTKPSRPKSSYGSTGRFANLGKDPGPPPPPPAQEPSGPPAFSAGGASDRMAFFRQAAEKEKEQKEKKKAAEESRRKQQEMIDAVLNGEMTMAKTNTEPAAPAPKEKTEKKELTDSEKMKKASAPCMKKREKKKVVRRTMSIGSIVLDWVQEMISDYPVEVTNFSSSWNNGMAFCALIHRFNPEEFDFSTLKPENKRENFDLAFNTGQKCKNIPILLDTEDMIVMLKPEPRSVQTYIQWIWSVYGPTSGYGPTPQEVQK